MVELLVPAGSPEAVTAAVQNGADAVYLSFDSLSDCRQAENFADSAFETAVRYCRIRNCRVYLAMNAPIREDEMQKAGGLALRAQRAGVDAVILRDLGLYSVLRRLLPDMPLFADHRMGFYTPESAAVAASLGFSRIFLPPEMPLEEIRRMAAGPVDTAVYAQTSLCAAAAGTCRMSVLMGGGSADRGLCSEPCRGTFTFGGRWDTTPLSWKDRSLLSRVSELEEMGVKCLALGDRKRRPEYVAGYTAMFAKAIREGQTPAPVELQKLERAFAPWGVEREGVYTPAETAESDGRETEQFLSELRKTYAETEERRVAVRFAVVARDEKTPVHLGVQDEDGRTAMLSGPMPEPEGDLALTEENLRECMYRTAGTPFRCEKVETVTAEGLRVPALELDAARRRLLFKLSEERSRPPERKEGVFPPQPSDKDFDRLPVMNFSFQNPAQMTPEMAALRPAVVYAPLELLTENPAAAEPFRSEGSEICAILPSVVCSLREEDELRALLRKAREQGVERVLAGNLGLAVLAGQEDMKLRGDVDLAVTNAYAVHSLAAAGFLSVCLSPELALRQIQATPKCADTELVIYGRLSAMTSETCLLKASAGRCVCSTPGQMADTRGGVWPVTRQFGCRNTVWMDKKLWLADRVPDWIQNGLWAVRLCFSTESPRECVDVADAYIHDGAYRPNGMTRGLYYRGTE